MNKLSDYEKIIGGSFNIKELWSNSGTFSTFGNILCGKPFPRRNDIKFVERSFYEKDYNGPDKDEVDAMPSMCFENTYISRKNDMTCYFFYLLFQHHIVNNFIWM